MAAALEIHPTQSPRVDPLPVPLARALSELTAGLGPVAPSRIALADAEGCVLAAPLLAPGPAPARAVALRPGIAVRADETAGATPYSPALLATAPARVEAGEELPADADAVLPEDVVSIGRGGAEVFETAAPGQWTRRAGEDARAGTMLRRAGDALSALDIAAACHAGVSECDVRRPRVALLGAPGKRARLEHMIASLCRSAGAEVGEADPEEGPAQADLILVVVASGGALAAAGRAGARIVAPRLALRPGEDGCAARGRHAPMILMPNRLADVLALWLCLVAPCLRALAGAAPPSPHSRPLTRKIASTVGFAEIALLLEAGSELEPIATGDLPLSAVAAAEYWHLVAPESEGYAAGSAIMAERLPGR